MVSSPPKCPKCKRVIAPEDINVARDVAYCRACNLPHEFSALAHDAELTDNVDFHRPPTGVWYGSDGREIVVGATHRSLGGALGALAISLFWNGIVSVFVLVALASTLNLLHVPLPHWFPAPKMNGDSMGVGMTIFLWIFLTPFIVIGTGMILAFLSCLAGRTEVRMRGSDGDVYTGVGPLGYHRRFDASAVKDVRMEDRQWHDSDGHRQRKTAIIIEMGNGKRVKFGTMLSDERRRFVAAAARKALMR